MRKASLVLFLGCLMVAPWNRCNGQEDLGTTKGTSESSLPTTPKKGDKAPNAAWKSLDGKEITLQELNKKGPVVLVVLRGYPGYQCPLCTQQVSSLLSSAKQFSEKKANVVLVYPGSAKNMGAKAKEFLRGAPLPSHFQLVLDPDYQFIQKYALRWDAPGETAYPSTFVIDGDGKVTYQKISRSHGDRADTQQVISAL